MTAVIDRTGLVYRNLCASIDGARSDRQLDNAAQLVRDARGTRRIEWQQFRDLRDRVDARRAQLVKPSPLSQDSPRDCRRCQSPMVRELGPQDAPDGDGNVVLETLDVCITCGWTWPVEEDRWTPGEIRRRVRVVQAHSKVCGPSCGPDAPCRASRIGRPAQPLTPHYTEVFDA